MKRKKQAATPSNTTVKKSDIANKVHKETRLSSPESTELVGQLFEHISDALSQGENVKLAGFGTFNLRKKEARLGRNPKTGKECLISSRTVLTFKPSNFMKERVHAALEFSQEPDPQVSTKRHYHRSSSITRNEWVALFELLGVFVYLQSCGSQLRVDEAIEVFIELKTIIEPKASISKRTISSWLTLNKDRLFSLTKAPSLNIHFETLLAQLENIDQKQDIIFAMLRIAIVGGDYTERARALIVQSILYWDISATVVDDIEDSHPDIAFEVRKSIDG